MDKPHITLEILRTHRAEILALAERYRATNVRVFGSVARGEATATSDVDLLVSYQPKANLLDAVALWQDLEELLGCPVDVVDDRAIKPRMRTAVSEDAVPL